MTENADEKEIILAICRSCGRDKRHAIVAEYIISDIDKHLVAVIEKDVNIFAVIQCQGCHGISFVRIERTKYFPDQDQEEDEEVELIWQYPEPFDEDIDKIFLNDEDLNDIPALIRNLYEELKSAFNAESMILAGLGLRTLLESICLVQNIEGANLKVQIENLQTVGWISKKDVPMLDKLRIIGNVSAHRMKSLPFAALENVLRSIYVISKKDKKLKIEKLK